jgi:hypothetical protein
MLVSHDLNKQTGRQTPFRDTATLRTAAYTFWKKEAGCEQLTRVLYFAYYLSLNRATYLRPVGQHNCNKKAIVVNQCPIKMPSIAILFTRCRRVVNEVPFIVECLLTVK